MKLNKLFPVLLVVLIVAAVFTVPAFAQEPNPPIVEPPVFDYSEISAALQNLLVALLVPCAGFLARWLLVQGNFAKAKLSNEQEYMLNMTIKIFVYAAEQLKVANAISNKFDYVIERVGVWLIARNISMDFEELRARIEAVVKQEFNSSVDKKSLRAG